MAVAVVVRVLALVLQQVVVPMQPVWMLLLGLVPVAALLRVLLVSVLVLLHVLVVPRLPSLLLPSLLTSLLVSTWQKSLPLPSHTPLRDP